MKLPAQRLAVLTAIVVAFAAAGSPGCSKKTIGSLVPNLRPSVELTAAPAVRDSLNPYFYAYHVNWSGNDPDGRIDHYEYCVDPTNTDSLWIKTTKNEQVVFFRATRPDPIHGNDPPTASDPHVFVIKAVDDHGLESARKNRAFFAFTIAPSVAILNPIPSALLRALVTPSVRIDWTGSDPDGQFSQKPVQYKFLMMDLSDPDNQIFLANPDSLRRREAAKNWAGWDSTSADTQFVQFTNLTPGKSYLFVLIGFDEAGAYSPVFTLNSNMLQLSAGFAASNGPRIHIFNQYIDFIYDSGGYSADPLREIPIEIPSGVVVPVVWEAFPSPGSRIQFFRWMVDGNINDNTPRSDENTDYIHWSQPSPTMPNFTILRPFTDGDHRFYLECADNNGQKSLGVLKMTAVTPAFNRQLLVLDDTRLEPDKWQTTNPPPGTCPLGYTKPWPSRAEFDTLLFAHGNVPWRCTRNPTSGVSTTPGLLAGYDFDTTGTRLGLENAANGVLLSKIGRYRNLIWLVDDQGAQYNAGLDQGIFPVTALWAMSGPGRASTLAAYVQLHGRVWLAGGGAAYASLINFDKKTNNQGQTTVFTNAQGELVPSRIMYDGAHWLSSLAVTKGAIHTFRYDYDHLDHGPGEKIFDPNFVVSYPWTQYDSFTGDSLRRPDYANHLPPEMRWKDPTTDALPPTRLTSQAGLFYQTSYPTEYILDNNPVLEDTDTSPDVDHEESVLDTLYRSSGVVLLSTPGSDGIKYAPTMTYYHGAQARQFVFSGFSLWSYSRQDCMQLIDFVLQDLWGLSRDQSIDRGSFTPAARIRGPVPPRIVTPAQRTISARVLPGATRE